MTLLVISTVPNEDVAYNLSKRLLEKRIAACVNIIKDVNSLYWRKESIGNSIEIIPLIKTTDEKYSEVEHLIKENHPYETPEIIALDIKKGFSKYLKWIEDETRSLL